MAHLRTTSHALLHALHFSFSAALVYVVVAAVFVTYVVSPAWLQHAQASGYGAFAATSFWNTTIPRYPTLNINSNALVQALTSQVQANGSRFDVTTQAAPVYTADTSAPGVAVVPIDCDGSGINPGLAALWQAVPIPFYAVSGGSDNRMIVYQTATNAIWEFDHMQKVSGQWQACHGGRIDGSTNGIFSDGLGVSGSGLALMGSQVSLADLKRGVIGHAIGLNVPSTGGPVWPAARSDGSGGAIAQGTRFQLDPSIDVDSLGLSSVGRMVARAAQTYGFVVTGSASSVSVVAENPISYTVRGLGNPYNQFGGLSLGGFPWDKLRALPGGYGQTGESPAIAAFTSSTTDANAGEQITFQWQASDVDSCAIPNVGTNLPATGSITAFDQHSDTSYTLSCSGPWGNVTRGLSVRVSGLPENAPLPTTTATTIDVPVSGSVNTLPSIDFSWAKEQIYKVVFFEHGNRLLATTVPPFLLDTTQLIDGPHTLYVRIYYRDGTQELRSIFMRIQNHAAQQLFTGPLSASTPSAPYGRVMIFFGMIGLFMVMALGFWFGWRRLYPHERKVTSWLISYV